jgi:serine/threonine protein kinase/Tfp pilus assembly protein PilF
MAQGNLSAQMALKFTPDDPTRRVRRPHLPREPLEAARAVGGQAPFSASANYPQAPKKVPDPFPPPTSHCGEAGLDYWYHCFSGHPEHAQLFRELHESDPEAAYRLALATMTMPAAGSEFLGFQLLAELGRGAFARVFLAHQGELANRQVVLKVAADIWGEVHTLAQLHHPHIVPVYSVHRCEPFQAVCMPFEGSTTLHDVIQEVRGRSSLPASGKILVQIIHKNSKPEVSETSWIQALSDLSYVQAIVWLASGLAAGLAHAHDHGIIHRDLKPANVLVTSQGKAMLLDFNAAADTKQGSAMAAWAAGTLPYMAPEQLAAFQGSGQPVDVRCDIYAFGIVLFELFTGRYPFQFRDVSLDGMLQLMEEDRRKVPPRLRKWNPAVTPALEAIVRRCLELEPERRYQSARELQEDLQCQRDHRPLRHIPEPSRKERLGKWVHRHPRLAAAGLVALMAITGLASLAGFLTVQSRQLQQIRIQQQEEMRQKEERDQARTAWQQFQEDFKHALFLLYTRTTEPDPLTNGIAIGSSLLEKYEVLENPDWRQGPLVRALPEIQQQQLVEAVTELLLLLARPVLWDKEKAKKPALSKALLMNERAESCSRSGASSPALWRQREKLFFLLGRQDRAKECRARADTLPLQTAQDHFWIGGEHLASGNLRQALPLLQQATCLEPQNFWAWFILANCYERLGLFGRAEGCYGACIALWPRFPWSHFNRGLAFLRQQEYRLACSDFDRVLRLRPNLIEAHLNRALARQGLRQFKQAEEDLTAALKCAGAPTRLFFLRARVRDQLGDKQGSQQDYDEGLRRPPQDEQSWLARGFARLSRDPQAALADFDEALRLNPRSFAALQNKAHVLAERLGRPRDALKVLNLALEYFPDSTLARGGRGVVLARLGQRALALKDAELTLQRDASPSRLYQVACIFALTSGKHPEDRFQALQLLSAALRKGYGFDLLEKDTDLDAIKALPEFRRLLDAARAMQPVAHRSK